AGEGLDALGLALPLSIAVGRVGCFLAGDDYGRPTDSALGVAFPEGHPPTTVDVLESRFGLTVDPGLIERYGEVIPVHPAQLYEVGISLVVFAVVFLARDHPHRAGWLFALWLSLYGIQRFVIELVRVNARVFLGLTVAQLLSLAALGLGVYLAVRLRGSGAEAGAPA
ncbi:MAG TPA: prolipoprotein diacylglyceryl transferase family protein, partial [Longimicrobiales bacterium]|nr:prolipoprotein diacylglyceryl transferase family protein [Longimicrobiales bacterium]